MLNIIADCIVTFGKFIVDYSVPVRFHTKIETIMKLIIAKIDSSTVINAGLRCRRISIRLICSIRVLSDQSNAELVVVTAFQQN